MNVSDEVSGIGLVNLVMYKPLYKYFVMRKGPLSRLIVSSLKVRKNNNKEPWENM